MAGLALAGLNPFSALAEVKLSGPFGDHMVLQSEMPAPIWGLAAPHEKVSVTFADQTKTAEADDKGKWQVKLDPLHVSSAPRVLTVKGNNTVSFSDVLVGEVWVASGQSNMAFPLFAALNGPEVIAQANDNELRFFNVPHQTAAEPQPGVGGKWEVTTPDSAKNWSAVSYFFAREIRKSRKCPVAVLNGSWGGTPIETWIGLDGFKKEPALSKPLEAWNKAVEQNKKVQADPTLVTKYQADLKQWQKEVQPAYNAELKKYNDAKAAGENVGAKPKPSTPEPTNPDPMAIPSPSTRPQTPTISFNAMIAPLIPYAMRGVIWYQGEANSSHGIEYRTLLPRLIEGWRGQWGSEFPFLVVQLPCNGPDPTPVADKGEPFLREAQFMALQLPKVGMAITIDVGNPNDVHPKDKLNVGLRLSLLARKIAYGETLTASGPLYKGFKSESGKIRVQFSETGTGLTPGQSPWLADKVLPFPTDKLIGFFIAGEDKQWVEAEAAIERDTVVVSSPSVPKPVAVRYGWANSPRCNLYNKEGLPASPFRTDDWEK